MPDRLEPAQIVELLEGLLLGSRPTLTGPQVAAELGLPLEVARRRWRSLGFTAVPDDEVAFTEADLDALRLTERMHDLGLVGEEDESALIRTLGHSFARLAEWQMGLLSRAIDLETTDLEGLGAIVMETSRWPNSFRTTSGVGTP